MADATVIIYHSMHTQLIGEKLLGTYTLFALYINLSVIIDQKSCLRKEMGLYPYRSTYSKQYYIPMYVDFMPANKSAATH